MSSRSAELPVHTVRPSAAVRTEARERDWLVGRAKALSWFSLAYMIIEGAVGIAAALAAGSVALLGFGLDSAIEALASMIVIWRFTGARRHSEDAERRAQRMVAVTFFLLAPYIAQDAIRTLINREHPGVSWVGIGLSISSIIVMPWLGRPSSGSVSGSDRVRPRARATRICCAPTSPLVFSPGWCSTPHSGRGGQTP